MKNGFYLSIYTQIDKLAKAYKIHERHDQHMALWRKYDNNVELVHYWEFERITGIKKHSVPFENISEATEFINRLLSRYDLTIEDMIEIWGTPELEKCHNNYTTLDMYPEYTYHSMCHLFSSMLQDTGIFFENKILAMAVDAGPDNLIDHAAKNKNYYTGVFSNNGALNFFHIPSSACLWAFMAYKFNLQEGTLMALGTASKSELLCDYQELLKGFVPVKNMADGGVTFDWFNTFADKILNLSTKDEGIRFNFFDPDFTEFENKISMVVKVIQHISCDVLANTISNTIDKFKINPIETYLSMSGGFTLNCSTNTYLMDKFVFKGFLAPPCVSDCGIALGIGIYAFYKNLGMFNFRLKNAYYGDDDTLSHETINNDRFVNHIKSISDFNDCTFYEDIEQEPIIWFNDRSEIGPRALGNRSIFADPRKTISKEQLNIIKQRQWWRPVAPVILEEALPEWFNATQPSEYMLKTYRVLNSKKELIPAILHIDGTARVQTVNEKNKDLYMLVNIFYQKTQVPILCNTSLNDRDEPIINNIVEALNFALRKGMRFVYVNRKRIELMNHNMFTSMQAEPRNLGNFLNPLADMELKELNPYELNIDDIEFYLNHPQLKIYKLNNKEQVEKVRKMIKYLRKIQWNSDLNRIIK